MWIPIFIGITFIFGQFSSTSFLQARSTVEGRVTTSDNRPIADLRVFLQTDTYSPVAQTITDGSGRYRFTSVLTGRYYVTVEPSGTEYERQSVQVDVNPFNVKRAPSGQTFGGEIFRQDIVLRLNKWANGGGIRSGSIRGTVFHQEVPEAARKQYATALKSLEKNDFETAKASLKSAIDIFADYYDALALLGSEYVRRQDFEEALPLLKRAVEVNKDGYQGHYALGVALVELKQQGEGIKALKRAVELSPDSLNANMRLGMTLAQSEQTRSEAIEALKKVAQLDKGKQIPQVFYFLAALYDKNRQYRESADALELFLHTLSQNEVDKREKLKKMIAERRQKASISPTSTTKN